MKDSPQLRSRLWSIIAAAMMLAVVACDDGPTEDPNEDVVTSGPDDVSTTPPDAPSPVEDTLDAGTADADAEPVEPDAEPTEPDVDPTDPDVDPTDPDVDPTDPDVDPTDPDVTDSGDEPSPDAAADVVDDAGPTDVASEDAEVTAAECSADTDCPPGGACEQSYCDQTTWTCEVEVMADGVPCDDGTACSAADTCQEGLCIGATALSCDDGNVCTDDLCDPATGCVYALNFGACDDGDPCTSLDQCEGGVCQGHGAACDDDNPCTADLCVPGTGECINTPDNILPCSDGNACTGGDHCSGGLCLPGEEDACDDGNACTDDSCDEGFCTNFPLEDEPCDDGEVCTVDDTCQLAACLPGQPNPCDDGNPCTSDSCETGVGCSHEPIVDAPCDDGDVCTHDEACDATSTCVPVSVTDCDDGNPCTVDNCHPQNACVYAVKGGLCDDGNPCTTGDFCAVGQCKGQPVTCDDANACTHDSCDDVLGCQFLSIADTCVDTDPCTDDSCDAEQGCLFTANSAPCDDGLLCTEADTCDAGSCVGQAVDCTDEDPCTAETCDAEEGCVAVVEPGIVCDDANPCTEGTICDATGVCGGGEAIPVDDDVACTQDACTQDDGITHTPDDSVCPVGRVCDPEAGCVPGATVIVISKVAWTEGTGLDWLSILNTGDEPFDLHGLRLEDATGASAHLVAADGDPDASILLAPGAVAAATRAPADAAEPVSDDFTMIFSFDDTTTALIPDGGTLQLVDAQDAVVDTLAMNAIVTSGDVGYADFPLAPGSATEFDALAADVAAAEDANDPAGLWCTWPAGAAAPEGPQLSCSRARLNEIALGGADGERWVEIHMPAGGHLEGLLLHFVDADGQQVALLGPFAGRTPMSSLVVFQDGVDEIAIPQLLDGSVQLIRVGSLLDAYGFGTLNVGLDATHTLPMVEGSAGPAFLGTEAAARIEDGADTDDHAADWTTVDDGSPGASNPTP